MRFVASNMRLLLLAGIVGAVVLALFGAHSRVPTASPPAASVATAPAPVTHSVPQPVAPPAADTIDPGTPGTARNVLYRFALAYGNTSAASAASEVRLRIALATPAYATALRASEAQAELDAVRGLPAGSQMVARVTSLELDPPQGDFTRATVTLEQLLVQSGGVGEPPVAVSIVADLLNTPAGWRVADFNPQP
jgi:hypothetical protein